MSRLKRQPNSLKGTIRLQRNIIEQQKTQLSKITDDFIRTSKRLYEVAPDDILFDENDPYGLNPNLIRMLKERNL